MSNPSTREPMLDKANIPVMTLKDQNSVGLYYEVIHGLARHNSDGTADVLLRQVSMFAVDRHLLTKRHTISVEIASSGGKTATVKEYQAQFRDESKSGLDYRLTPMAAFQTITTAWSYATRRAKLASMEVAKASGGTETVTLAAYSTLDEPFMYPISEADTDAIRTSEDNALARKLARAAEKLWPLCAPGDTPYMDLPSDGSITPQLEKFIDALIQADQASLAVFAPAAPIAPHLPEALTNLATGGIAWG